jgi:signal transduction histidine kinase/DNA-binding response OmpR family regulator
MSLLDDPVQPARYLWVGTKGGGLDRLDKQTGLFSHITEKQGLPNKVVYGILSDEFNNLWLSTNRGLAQFNPKTGTFHNFTKGDGLQDDEFNTNSFVKTPSGRLLFGGVHGLTAFRAKDVVRVSGVAPQAHLIGLKVNNEPVMVGGPDGILTEGIEFTKRIELAHDQNLLTLEFGVMDYANSAKNRYRYRLEGIDQDWVEAGTNRFANYAQLPNGNYTLQMMGSANGDVWSKPIDLQIQVHPPFYRSWWAYLLYMLVLTAIGWQLYRFQTQRLLLQQQVVFEQKEASRLAELDTLKTQFFANISHEFRTPLTLILGPIEQAIQDYAHDARFPLIQHNANRLLSLINQLLDLSKLEAGQLRPEAERGDIAAFFRTLASSFIPLAESRQVRFLFTQDREEQQADFDRDKIDKIVTNLLANAFKFTPAGKEVYMNIRYRNANPSGTVQITVEDTGIGIAPEHVARIFERFYQVDAKANRPFEGTGIGLALVHQLVKVLGGTIQVASIEDVGTSFTVTLPLVTGKQPDENARLTQLSSATAGPIKKDGDYVDSRTDPAPAPSMGSEEGNSSGPIGTPTGNENILLIIDDNADIRAYVRSIFEVDYQIIEAGDGQDGLDKATASLPNVVICDLMMPQLDGFGFCKALKGGEATSHIPVVMLTAKATIEDRIEGLELGADDYLTKPFNRIELQVRVRNLIGQRQRLYRHFKTQAADSTSAVNPLQLTERTLLKAEQQFMDRLTTLVMQQIDNADFTVEKLAEGVNMSRVQLHRKLKALANTTATDFIRQIRLTKAAELLQTGEQSVSQVAYSVGFDNLSYFAKVFQEHYGVLPSYYNKRTTSVS